MGKREDILKATLELISEEGLQSITFSKLFKKANIGSSTFYHYFESKEEAVSDLFINTRTQMGEAILKGDDPDLTIYERMKSILVNIVKFSLDHPQQFLFIENYCESPSIPEEVRKLPALSDAVIFTLIKEGQKNGIIREMDPILCCQVVNGIISSAIKGYLSGKYPLDEIQIQTIVEISWKAIRI